MRLAAVHALRFVRKTSLGRLADPLRMAANKESDAEVKAAMQKALARIQKLFEEEN